ncbi:MAG TPA: DinB family protein [Flavitalea sp.]|nr:DinB family protein [Flavitalea sp.]
MIKIGRPNIQDAPSWYPYYFSLAEGDDLIEALRNNQKQMLGFIGSIPASKENFKYAADKWTVRQVLIHVADDERYYAYKSFCYSRQINVNLEVPPDGPIYSKHFNAANRTLKDIAEELYTIREATISLFSNMTNVMLDFKDFPTKDVYSARSLGWMVAGHSVHHCRFLKENYLV